MRSAVSVSMLSAVILLAAPAQAGTVERACIASPRGAAQPQLCGCIQQAADMTLSAGDQKLAARFFTDPDQAQRIRQSDRRSHEDFWKRYTAFGELAEAVCG